MSINFKEMKISVPYMILPPDQGDSALTLLVSAPDGTVLEFPITSNTADDLDDVLIDNGLWKTFFTSLLESLGNGTQSVAQGIRENKSTNVVG